MPYVYKYTDLKDNIVKYVGIIRVENNFPNRFKQHESENWVRTSFWHIEYFEVPTIADAEILEGHFIWFYGTNNHYNKSKADWGRCSYVPDPNQFVWKTYVMECKATMRTRKPAINIVPTKKKVKPKSKDFADELREFTKRGTIRASEVAGFLGDKNVSRVKQKYLSGLEAIGGRAYLITDVAERLKEHCVMK